MPESDKTRFYRVLHVDPAGNLPAKVVEMNSKNVPSCIFDLRKLKRA